MHHSEREASKFIGARGVVGVLSLGLYKCSDSPCFDWDEVVKAHAALYLWSIVLWSGSQVCKEMLKRESLISLGFLGFFASLWFAKRLLVCVQSLGVCVGKRASEQWNAVGVCPGPSPGMIYNAVKVVSPSSSLISTAIQNISKIHRISAFTDTHHSSTAAPDSTKWEEGRYRNVGTVWIIAVLRKDVVT